MAYITYFIPHGGVHIINIHVYICNVLYIYTLLRTRTHTNIYYYYYYYCTFFFPDDLAAAVAHSIVRDDVVVVVNEAEAFGNGVQIIAILIFIFIFFPCFISFFFP